MAHSDQTQLDERHPRATDAADAPPRKPYVKPEISDPTDVLAATTFFQVVDSGGTGSPPRPRG